MKNFSFSMGTAMGTVLMVCLYANNFVIPVWTQELLGFDATHAGLAVLPRALIMFLVLPATGRLYNLVDPRITSAVGFVIMAASGLMLKNLSLDSGISEVFWPLIVWGWERGRLELAYDTHALCRQPKGPCPGRGNLQPHSAVRRLDGLRAREHAF